MEIFPSLISSDLLNLGATLKQLDAYVAGYHIDVMDNQFVPNLTWGAAFVAALQKGTEKPLHIHLMVKKPFLWLKKIWARPGDVFIFHYEAIENKREIAAGMNAIRNAGFKVGIAINPNTEVVAIKPFLDSLDVLLVMSVNPGFSGQAFIPEVLRKAEELECYKKDNNLLFILAMDGGINEANIASVAAAGVTQVGAASAIFSHLDAAQAIENLKKLCI